MEKVTIIDVARVSGYGVGTVSRVTRGDKSVKPETREKILKVIDELHYTPNVNGVRLRQEHSHVLAVMVPVINHPFFAQFVEEVEQAADEKGYSVLLITSKLNVSREHEILQKIKQKEVDGAIFVTHYEHSDEELMGCSLVSVDRHLNHSVPFVSSDNYDATKRAIERFIANGDKKIGFIGTKPFVKSEVSYREQAYLDTMNEHGLEIRSMNEIVEHGEEEQLVDKFLSKYSDLDAIFASGNTLTQITYHKLKEMGKKLPEDVELIGYDGVFSSWEDETIISSIQQPIKEMAKASVEILIKTIKGEEVSQKNIFKTNFIKGTTTK